MFFSPREVEATIACVLTGFCLDDKDRSKPLLDCFVCGFEWNRQPRTALLIFMLSISFSSPTNWTMQDVVRTSLGLECILKL